MPLNYVLIFRNPVAVYGYNIKNNVINIFFLS